MSIKLEVGKEYVNKSGDVIKIEEVDTAHYSKDAEYCKHIYVGKPIGGGGCFLYTEDGAYDIFPTNYDIISENIQPTIINKQIYLKMPVPDIKFNLSFPHAKMQGCQHSYKIYDSGWTRYEYCERCDARKE